MENSIDGTAWTPVAPLPFRLGSPEAGAIFLPDAGAARYWRIVAAGDYAQKREDDWTISGLEFLVPYDPDGYPIASGNDESSLEKVFAGEPGSSWVSPERGQDVNGRAWIGYVFPWPEVVRRIQFEQQSDRIYREDRVMVQASPDGVAWHDVLSEPAHLAQGMSATVDLPDVSAARYWRIVASDNATEVEAWVVAGMKFFVADQHVAHVPYVPLALDGGGAIASNGGAGSPQSAFDGNQETFWVSGERGQAVRGQAWLGYGFAAPQAVRQIRIRQTANPRFRQDLVAVEKSVDGGATWLPAASNPVRLPGSIGRIDLPEGEPARLWRVVAAGGNAVSPEDAWSVFELGFYAPEDKINRPPVVALDLSGGEPISSGEGSGSPQRAFDGMPETFWVSAERGPSVRGQAWIGYSFGALQAVRHIRIRQPANAPYRQDFVRTGRTSCASRRASTVEQAGNQPRPGRFGSRARPPGSTCPRAKRPGCGAWWLRAAMRHPPITPGPCRRSTSSPGSRTRCPPTRLLA